MVRLIALVPFVALLAFTNAMHCWTGSSQAQYYQEDCESNTQDMGSKYCGTLVIKAANVTTKGCGGTLAAQGAKCDKDGKWDVAVGTVACCSADYCNSDGVGTGGNPVTGNTTAAPKQDATTPKSAATLLASAYTILAAFMFALR